MKTLCIVPCGVSKIWDREPKRGPTAARYVYTGSFASKCRQYAEKFHPGHWCILSAKHGFLRPDDFVPGPYNVTFKDSKTKAISKEKLNQQAANMGLLSYDQIVVLGGKQYSDRVIQIFTNHKISLPLQGCRGIGYMMQRLHEAVTSGREPK